MFVAEHRDLGVELIRRVLGNVASSTFYGWLSTPPACERDEMDKALLSEIADIRASGDGRGADYGSPRVHETLRRNGIRVGKKRVERLMRSQGWQGKFRRRSFKHATTVQDPTHQPAPDLVNRRFRTARPNALWVADVSEIVYLHGKFYLAAVRDAFSNKIVGWATSTSNDTDLVLAALTYAAWHRASRARIPQPVRLRPCRPRARSRRQVGTPPGQVCAVPCRWASVRSRPR